MHNLVIRSNILEELGLELCEVGAPFSLVKNLAQFFFEGLETGVYFQWWL
jgi:hypothetical protein